MLTCLIPAVGFSTATTAYLCLVSGSALGAASSISAQSDFTLPGNVSPFKGSKVTPCPAHPESLLPGKGLGTVRLYFSCRKSIRFGVYMKRLILGQADQVFRYRTLPSQLFVK